MYWFTADLHFGHRLLTNDPEKGLGIRPYDTADEMNEAIIEIWNAHVRPEDKVFHLGDFAFMSPQEGMVLREQLNGSICNIRGNHCGCESGMDKLGAWEWNKDIYYLRTQIADEDIQIVLCHYPIESWMNRQHGAIHLHGHCHGNLTRNDPRRIDVGWDCFGRPVPLTEIWSLLAHAPYEQVDGHHPGQKQ